jgi:hypothetical protein
VGARAPSPAKERVARIMPSTKICAPDGACAGEGAHGPKGAGALRLARNVRPVFLVQVTFAFPAGVVHVDDLQLGVEVQSRGTLFTIADPCSLNSAERNMRFAACRW